jgi:hypothetical protein
MNLFKYFAVVILVSGINIAQTVDSLYEVGTWQGFKSGAVSFTFDDNCANQLSVAMPMFDQYGFKMTFYAVINWDPNWTALQKAALNGHEVGSHTMSHSSLNSLSNDQQTAEYKNSQDAVNSHITAQKCLTIAYPNCLTGNVSLCNQYYVAARICSGVIVPKTPADFMNISSIVCGSQGSVQRTSDFTNKAEAAAAQNGWVVFLIHAIDNESGYSPTSSSELKGALDYLDLNKNKFWVSSFSNIARYIKERNNASVKQISAKDTVIIVSVTDTLNNSVFNYPITIRRALPQGWTSARIIQNSKKLSSQVINANSKNYIIFDVVPDSGDIQIIKDKITEVKENYRSQIIKSFLFQNYPNPFNPVTTIDYQITEKSFVSLKIYDVQGREISTLVNDRLMPGNYSAKFDGQKLSSGLYLCRLNAGNYSSIKKLMLLK